MLMLYLWWNMSIWFSKSPFPHTHTRIYIYIYIYIKHIWVCHQLSRVILLLIKSCWEFLDSQSPSTPIIYHPWQPESVQCWCKPLLIGQHWHDRESCFGVLLYFSGSVLHVLFVLLEWFVRWEVSGRIAVYGLLLPRFVQDVALYSWVVPI